MFLSCSKNKCFKDFSSGVARAMLAGRRVIGGGDGGRLSCSATYYRLKASGGDAVGLIKAQPTITASAATGVAIIRKDPVMARHGPAVRYAVDMRYPGQGVLDDGRDAVSANTADM
jgi:hypothetical protein